jgi:hypothetical protein
MMKDEGQGWEKWDEMKAVIVVDGKVYAGRVLFLPDEFRMIRTFQR